MKRLLFAISFLVLVVACTAKTENIMTEKPRFLVTKDGTSIAYSFYPAKQESPPGVILLHMLNRDRHDYDDFARALADAGFSVVSIDFRGHGQSAGSWKKFSAEDWNAMQQDVRAAHEFLLEKGVNPERVAVVGASIGANHALRYAAQHEVKSVVAISPGLDYRGITTKGVMSKISQPVLLVAAEDDSYSADSVRTLKEEALGKTAVKIYPAGGHGTHLFALTDLAEVVLAWLKQTV